MKIKRTTFVQYFTIAGFRKIYPRSAANNQAHLTIENEDFQTVGDPVAGDVEFTKFHYTESGDETKRIAFEEVDGTWRCTRDLGYVPPPLRAVVPRAKALAKQMITALDGECGW
jgi:hypothetical protein